MDGSWRLAMPWALGLLALAAVLWLWRRRRPEYDPPAIGFSATGWITGRARAPRWPGWLMGAAFLLLTLSLSRPQEGVRQSELESRGVDIVLSLDISTSMRAEDFQPQNRLSVAKVVAEEFVRARPRDRLGLVAFAATAFTQCPLTLNHEAMVSLLQGLDFGMVEDGTAIGMGLATAVNRLRESKANSKVVILLTDGINNRGAVDPATAAELARALGVRVYTIGVGTTGVAPVPVDDPLFGRRTRPMQVEIDEPTLEAIAARTGGRYFRATDTRSLSAVYREIDRLERTDLADVRYDEYAERGAWLCAAAFLLFAAGWGFELLKTAVAP
jgi:Ca-activated chloride channel family protein